MKNFVFLFASFFVLYLAVKLFNEQDFFGSIIASVAFLIVFGVSVFRILKIKI